MRYEYITRLQLDVATYYHHCISDQSHYNHVKHLRVAPNPSLSLTYPMHLHTTAQLRQTTLHITDRLIHYRFERHLFQLRFRTDLVEPFSHSAKSGYILLDLLYHGIGSTTAPHSVLQ